MKTCPLCGNKYSDSWTNWYSKYCCKECYKNSNTKFNLNDKVYTYINHKQGKSGNHIPWYTRYNPHSSPQLSCSFLLYPSVFSLPERY